MCIRDSNRAQAKREKRKKEKKEKNEREKEKISLRSSFTLTQ